MQLFVPAKRRTAPKELISPACLIIALVNRIRRTLPIMSAAKPLISAMTFVLGPSHLMAKHAIPATLKAASVKISHVQLILRKATLVSTASPMVSRVTRVEQKAVSAQFQLVYSLAIGFGEEMMSRALRWAVSISAIAPTMMMRRNGGTLIVLITAIVAVLPYRHYH